MLGWVKEKSEDKEKNLGYKYAYNMPRETKTKIQMAW